VGIYRPVAGDAGARRVDVRCPQAGALDLEKGFSIRKQRVVAH